MGGKNRYDELLEFLLEKGIDGVMDFNDVWKQMKISKEDLFLRIQRILEHNNKLISTSSDGRAIGFHKHYIIFVREFLDNGGFTQIDNLKSIENIQKTKSLELTEYQLRNAKLTRTIAIIGCITGVVSLLWKVIELIVKVE